MKHSALKAAIIEAERFLRIAKKCDKVARTIGGSDYIYGGKDSGAARRASMDLTRSLAELRSREVYVYPCPASS